MNMKKSIIALSAIVLAALTTLTACNQGGNAYEKAAEKYGYWHGLGGISWGMPVSECKEILSKQGIELSEMPQRSESDKLVQQNYACDAEMFGKKVILDLGFIDMEPVEENGEWLYSIAVHIKPEDAMDKYELIKQIAEMATEAGVDYHEDFAPAKGCTNKVSLSNMPESEAKTTAIGYLNDMASMYATEVLRKEQSDITVPLDKFSIPFANSTSESDVEMPQLVSFSGETAALLALAETGRKP